MNDNEIVRCNLCERKCNVNRNEKIGYCKATNSIQIAKADLFFGEEPCLAGERGNGAIFFSNCSLRCVFCQNNEISLGGKGKTISCEKLADIFRELEDKGASHINLVTPTHYVNQIINALKIYKPKIPVIYNTHSYESTKTIEMLKDYVDIYLADLKYCSKNTSSLLANCPDYFEVASRNIKEMCNQKPLIYFENGLLKQGVVVRHMIMPLLTRDSIAILKFLHDSIKDKAIVSLMSQYTPLIKQTGKLSFLNRPITQLEQKIVTDYFLNNFENGYVQEKTSSNKCFIPKWDI